MTQAELQLRLGKALGKAVSQYLKDGGKTPERGTGALVIWTGPENEDWVIEVGYGGCEAPGSIFFDPL